VNFGQARNSERRAKTRNDEAWRKIHRKDGKMEKLNSFQKTAAFQTSHSQIQAVNRGDEIEAKPKSFSAIAAFVQNNAESRDAANRAFVRRSLN
jgi:hypothetical protein